MQQSEALSLLKMGKNIFLTGAAGAGKTYLLNNYIRYLKDHHVEVAVTASTGIAATHLQGTTIHSWSGIGVKDSITKKEMDKLLASSRIKRNYKRTKVLIIDEISMLHKHQLDMVDAIARYINASNEAFGGIQVVLCGDFFQLPPVSSSVTAEEKQFAFESAAWQEGNFHVCYLQEQHRQGDDPLLVILNDIRNGTAGEHTRIPLRTRYKKEPLGATKATKLYSRNINVDVINENELDGIEGEEKTFTMTTTGFNSLVEGLKKSCLAPEQLKLKIGAEVMFIKNDASGRYVNGTRCVVTGFEKSEDAWPVVKTYQNQKIIVQPEEWKYEDNGVVRATISQVPLRLAWAITIHKSQGMTLDAAEIDLGDAFEPGMGYVALSRVRSLTGLKLMNLNAMALKVNSKILQHDTIFKECSAANVEYLQSLSEAEQTKCHRNILLERFDGTPTKPVNNVPVKKRRVKVTATHFATLAMINENLSVEEIAEKRGISIGSVLSHIEKLKAIDKIDDAYLEQLKEMIPKEEFDIIFAEMQQCEEGMLKPLYDKFSGIYSYVSIRLVKLFAKPAKAEH